MLDIGWSELLVIAVILIVVVGPKDLPPMIRAFGKMTARLRRTAGEFRAQFDEALREAELDDLRQSVDEARKLNPASSLRDAINPLRQMGNEIKADLQKATKPDNKSVMPPDAASLEEAAPVLPEIPAPLSGTPSDLSQPAPVAAPAAVPAPAAAAVATSASTGTDTVKASAAKPASRSRKPKTPAESVPAPVVEAAAAPAKRTRKAAAPKAAVEASPVKAARTSKPRKTKTEDRA